MEESVSLLLQLAFIVLGIGVMIFGPVRSLQFVSKSVLFILFLGVGAYAFIHVWDYLNYSIQNPSADLLYQLPLFIMILLFYMTGLMRLTFGPGKGTLFLQRVISNFFYDILKLPAKALLRLLRLFKKTPLP